MQTHLQLQISNRARPSRGRRWFVGAVLVLVGGLTIDAAQTSLADAATASAEDAGLNLYADLGARQLKVRMGDSTIETYPIAIGKDSKPTPAGAFKIRKIVWNPAWIPPDEKWAKGKTPQPPGAKANPMKLVKIFFKEPDYYIHGTGEVESLGDAASHGCLRMDPDDAYRVARDVMQHGGQPRDEGWFWRVLHFRSETKTVYLDHPIPITVGY